ncbi:MAG: diguanylate cyclase [Kangiellaceae bacterium]
MWYITHPLPTHCDIEANFNYYGCVELKRLLASFVAIFIMAYLLVTSTSALASNHTCELSVIVDNQLLQSLDFKKHTQNEVVLPFGESVATLNCELKENAVFSFKQKNMVNIQWHDLHQGVEELVASKPSFLLPIGKVSMKFSIYSYHKDLQEFVLEPVPSYIKNSLINNMTMALFYGLCLTLIFYVAFTGRVLGDTTFLYYSLYVFCAATFFLLQEGQLNIILPKDWLLLSPQVYLLFAGLTIMSATMFIIRIVDLHIDFPKTSLLGLQFLAAIACFISISLMWIKQDAFGTFLADVVSSITLLIMFSVVALVILQVYRKVELAWLILLSLLIMLGAMLLRVTMIDVDPFIHSYALIIAFAIEAFIFAIVVSSRVKHIQEEKVRAQTDANTDVLSNLLNRRGWEALAGELIDYQHKHGGLLCLLYIDLDNFKAINDSHGHDCGDKLLIIVSKIIRNQTRQNDILGRIGGDEFVVLGHFKSEKEPNVLAQRMRERLNNFSVQLEHNTTIEASASVGQLILPLPPASVNEMLKKADKSMYQYKQKSASRTAKT